MIDQIFWHYIERGLHLVTFTNGREAIMSSAQIAMDFNLGQLRRIGA